MPSYDGTAPKDGSTEGRHSPRVFITKRKRANLRTVIWELDAQENICGVGVTRKESGGALQPVPLPAGKRQGQADVDIIVAIEVGAAAAGDDQCCMCHGEYLGRSTKIVNLQD